MTKIAFKACLVDGCSKHARTRGWCTAHYTRWLRHGDPEGGRTPDGEPLAFLEQAFISETDDCIPWPFAKRKKGHGTVYIKGRLHVAARVVCERVHGAPPAPEYQAAHNCGKGHEGCINPRHLRWATGSENEADKLIHGTHNRGERHNMAKLTEDQVLDIRRRAGRGETQSALSREYGVRVGTIHFIVHRKTWWWLAA